MNKKNGTKRIETKQREMTKRNETNAVHTNMKTGMRTEADQWVCKP